MKKTLLLAVILLVCGVALVWLWPYSPRTELGEEVTQTEVVEEASQTASEVLVDQDQWETFRSKPIIQGQRLIFSYPTESEILQEDNRTYTALYQGQLGEFKVTIEVFSKVASESLENVVARVVDSTFTETERDGRLAYRTEYTNESGQEVVEYFYEITPEAVAALRYVVDPDQAQAQLFARASELIFNTVTFSES